MAQGNQVCDAGVASENTTAFKEENNMSDKACFDDEDSCVSSDEIRKPVGNSPNTSDAGCKEEKLHAFPSALFKHFADYGSRIRRFNGHDKLLVASNEERRIKIMNSRLSTNAIIRLAGEKFIQFSESSVGDLLMVDHLFSSLNKDDARDAKLVFYLLASAEKVGQKQYDQAITLLDCCDELSSSEGHPIERLVFYFSKALSERIDQETIKTRPLKFWKKQLLDVQEEMMSIDSSFLAIFKAVPAGLIIQLSAIQAIVDHVTETRKIHIIDLSIKGGQQHSMLIQALVSQSEPPLEHLKITALATNSKHKIQETGNRLRSFAQSVNLPFCFNVVMVEDILNLEEGIFSVDSDETVIVYSAFFLSTLLAEPDRLENLLKVIRNIKPCVMIVAEMEANHNSPVFVSRFIEALFFYGAQFDCFEDCMKNDESNRSYMESFYLSKGIHNIVAAEGEQRTFRKVKVEVWRAFFERFEMVETSLGMLSLYQASLVLKDFPYASSFTFNMDGESLIIGWKETPLYSLSAWKFM